MVTPPTDSLPPAADLSTTRIAHLLCHRLLDSPTATTLYHESIVNDDIGLPRSWLIASHKTARRHRPGDDGDRHMPYHDHSDIEILTSLSVKLDFDLDTYTAAAAAGNDRHILTTIYNGLRELDAATPRRDDGPPHPGFHSPG
jgi:hypothetical protein